MSPTSEEKTMRKTLLILALTAVTVLASSSDAFAQRGGGRGGGGGGRGGGGGGRGGYGGGYGRGGYGGGYGGIYLGLGNGYYGGSYGGGYYSPSYYSQPYYSESPNYYSDAVQVPSTDVRQSFYAEPASQQQTARVMVRVPSADTRVWFDNTPTSQQGMERTFNSPALDPGSSYVYTVKARWTENGQTRDREQRVSVQAGQTATVDFRGNSSEAVPLPLPKRQ
jgi:uncharacterized protein (TIGR03000 family)